MSTTAASQEYLPLPKYDHEEEKRQLLIILEIDAQTKSETRRLNEIQQNYLDALRKASDKNAEQILLQAERKSIEQLQREVLAQSKEKIQIAKTLYQAVDQSILDLETMLKSLEEQQAKQIQQQQLLQAQKQQQQQQQQQQAQLAQQEQQLARQKSHNHSDQQKRKSNKKEIKNSDKSRSKQDRYSSSSSYSNVDTTVVQPIQNDEPKYCFCDKPYYGNMIGCEDDNCTKEWFHYECVGITEAPEGSWYCIECIRRQRRQH